MPVVALSQLSRAPEARTEKRPQLSDLRESGALEQDADIVMFIYREEEYKPTEENRGIAEIIIGKQRNGPTGMLKLAFIKEYTRFENLEWRNAWRAVRSSGMSPAAVLDGLRPARATVDLDRLAANYRAVRPRSPSRSCRWSRPTPTATAPCRSARHLVASGADRCWPWPTSRRRVALRAAGIARPHRGPGRLRPGPGEAAARARASLPSSPRRARSSGPCAGGARLAAAAPRPRQGRHGHEAAGLRAPTQLDEAAARLAESGHVEVDGVMTHLASRRRGRRLSPSGSSTCSTSAWRAWPGAGMRPPLVHAANSAGLAFVRPTPHPGASRPAPLRRAPAPALARRSSVRPVMTVSADIALVKDVPAGTAVSYGGRWVAPRPSRIATVPLGYADGVPRTDAMREEGQMLVRGAPRAGGGHGLHGPDDAGRHRPSRGRGGRRGRALRRRPHGLGRGGLARAPTPGRC